MLCCMRQSAVLLGVLIHAVCKLKNSSFIVGNARCVLMEVVYLAKKSGCFSGGMSVFAKSLIAMCHGASMYTVLSFFLFFLFAEFPFYLFPLRPALMIFYDLGILRIIQGK